VIFRTNHKWLSIPLSALGNSPKEDKVNDKNIGKLSGLERISVGVSVSVCALLDCGRETTPLAVMSPYTAYILHTTICPPTYARRYGHIGNRIVHWVTQMKGARDNNVQRPRFTSWGIDSRSAISVAELWQSCGFEWFLLRVHLSQSRPYTAGHAELERCGRTEPSRR
jgi:hypothetical protein